MNRIAILLLCLMHLGASDPIKWELVKKGQGILVYSAKVPEYPVKSVRAELQIDAKVSDVVATIMNVGSYQHWVYHCKKSTILQKISPNEVIYHHITDAPWPVSDRDQVSHFKLTQKTDGTVFINSHTVNEVLPEQAGLVRVKNAKAQWKFIPISNNKVKAEYELFFDPAGDVPAWVINVFIANGPFESMVKLKERVKLESTKN
jgi:hypothetical protein